jgi:hypothetical protein
MASTTYTDQEGLTNVLKGLKGTTIITIDACVEPTMRKTNNPFIGRVKKVSRVNGMVGWNYQNSVNNQREREGNEEEFVAHPRKWGERVQGTPFVTHKGQVYLELKVQNVQGTTYFLDNRPATDAEIEAIQAFMPKRAGSGRQQVDKAVILRDYKMSSIKAFRAFGQEHILATEYDASRVAISA